MTPPRSPRPQGPRVNLTLTPELNRVLERIAEATGTGKATFIREMLIGSMPHLVQVAEACEQAKAQQIPDALTKLSRVLRTAASDAQQAELELTKVRRAVRRKHAKKGG